MSWFESEHANNTKTIKILAQLGARYNSHYRAQFVSQNLFDGVDYRLNFFSKFIPVSSRYRSMQVDMLYWILTTEQLKHLQNLEVNITESSQSLGNSLASSLKNKIEIYIPRDLVANFSYLVDQLPPPHRVLSAVLTPSGRSFWVFDEMDEQFAPHGIKINTGFIDDLVSFNRKKLSASDVEYALLVSEYLKLEKNIFCESSGVSFIPRNAQPDQAYVCQRRSLDFKRCDIRKDDWLVPLHTLCGPDFWQDTQMMQTIGLDKFGAEAFFTQQLPKAFAELIRNSLDKTFLHFEVHQQNLTAQLRNGHLVKLIYHDLLDTVFDPVTYFLLHPDAYEKKLELVTKLTGSQHFNCAGEIRNYERTLHDFTVTNFYRRYLRNFGEYQMVSNYFCGKNIFYSHDFEVAVLMHLKLTDEELQIDELSERLPNEVLKRASQDLFWCIERLIDCKQRAALKNILQITPSDWPSSEPSTSEQFMKMYRQRNGYVSLTFPNQEKFMDQQLFGKVQQTPDQRLFWGSYDKRPFIAVFN